MGRSTVHYTDNKTNNALKSLHNKLRPAGAPVQRVDYKSFRKICLNKCTASNGSICSFYRDNSAQAAHKMIDRYFNNQ